MSELGADLGSSRTPGSCRASVCVCVYVCVCVRVCVRACVRACVCIYESARANINVCVRA